MKEKRGLGMGIFTNARFVIILYIKKGLINHDIIKKNITDISKFFSQ